MEVITDREIIYNSSPELEAEMIDKYSYFPDKPTSPIFNKQSPLTFNKGFEPTKTEFKLPELKLTKDKKDTIIPQFRTETKTDLRKETFGTKKPIVIEPKKEQVIATENVEVISEKKGMGLGAKIGIGVGILAILGLGIYLIKKNK